MKYRSLTPPTPLTIETREVRYGFVALAAFVGEIPFNPVMSINFLNLKHKIKRNTNRATAATPFNQSLVRTVNRRLLLKLCNLKNITILPFSQTCYS